MLTHMALQGAQKRILGLGGRVSAQVHQEKTVFTAQVLQKDIPKAMELLADMVTKPNVDEAALAKERDVLLRNHDTASREYACRIMDHVHESAFAGTDLARTANGTESNLANLSGKDLTDFAQTHFTSQGVVIAAAGAVKHDALVDLAGKHFGGMTNAAAPSMQAAIFTGCDKRIRFDSMKVILFSIFIPVYVVEDTLTYLMCCTAASTCNPRF